jgi:hypothetical protein
MPNTIFSGDITVRAKDKTEYTVDTGGYKYTYT